MEKTTYYFAFGSNINHLRMTTRKAYFKERRLAKLPNYEFKLNKLRINGTAAANITPCANSSVYGVLYTGTEATLRILDKFEGVTNGQYARENVIVELENGENVEAVTYVACSGRCVDNLCQVKTDYLDHILCGRDILPDHYIKFLEGFKSWCVD